MLDKILDYLENHNHMIISESKLEDLLKEVRIVEEKNTYIRDIIRILSSDETILVQEISNKDEIMIRKVESIEMGYEFIQDRLSVYENMWNGCGCKIDYYK